MASNRRLVLLAAAVALAGCSPARTHIVTFLPAAVPPRAQRVSGSCWTHSIAAPARPDAWRCTLGNRIEDPCFEIAGESDLLCGANPADPAQAHPLALALTLPLPHEPAPPGIAPQPWLLELADGAVCRPFTGTRPPGPAGRIGTYACSDGSTVFGPLEPPQSNGIWLAEVGRVATSAAGPPQVRDLHQVPVKAAWR